MKELKIKTNKLKHSLKLITCYVVVTKTFDKLMVTNNKDVLQHFVNVFSCLDKVF